MDNPPALVTPSPSKTSETSSVDPPSSPKPPDSPSRKSFTIDIGDLTFKSRCGKGMYGTVYLGEYQGKQVAIKEMSLTPHQMKNPKNRQRLLDEFQKEARILSKLHHLNIVEFYGLAHSDNRFCIVTEFLNGGTLYDLIQTKPFCLTNYNIHRIAVGIAAGCSFLHKANILHRDLKSQNIMLTTEGNAKVVDFGFSRLQAAATMTGFRGTPVYMSPEVMRYASRYDHRIDVFSFGILLWEMCTGVFPWSTGSLKSVVSIQQVLHCVSKKVAHLPIPDSVVDKHGIFIPLLQKCWSYDPGKRPDFDQVLLELSKIGEQIKTPPEIQANNGIGLENFNKPPISTTSSIVSAEQSPYLPKELFNQKKPTTNITTKRNPPYMDAQRFWKKYFNQDSDYSKVPIENFYKMFLKEMFGKLEQTEPQILPQLKKQFTPANIYLVCWSLIERDKASRFKPTGKDFVTVESYTDFLHCWGGFGNPLVNCIATFSRRFFYGCISWSETLERLKDHPVGSYLLRLSRKSPHKIGIAFIREKNGHREITQLLVDLEDVLPSWDDYLNLQPLFKTPVKQPRTNFFPTVYERLHKIHMTE